MTKSQLRQYAKANGISIAEAKAQIIANLSNALKATYEQKLKFYKKEDLMKDGPMGTTMILTPSGWDNTDDGLHGMINYQIYDTTGDMPVYYGNTATGARYAAHLAAGGERKREWMTLIGDSDGAHIVISYVGHPSDGAYANAQLAMSLPDDQRAFVRSKIPAATGVNGPAMAKVFSAATPLGLL